MSNPLVIFDIMGSYAMFRKFYTNSSSLSYPFPPRSSVAGLIAGLMGYERDSYSDEFSIEKCKIAVSVRTPVRSVMQTVNYVMTKAPKEFDGSAGGTQIPIEWIYPTVGKTKLHYRIYVTHENTDWVNRLSKILEKEEWIYPPYLGLTECIAEVKHVATVANWYFEEPEGAVDIATVIPTTALRGAPALKTGAQIIKERTPLSLSGNRKLEAICDVLYERTGKGITAKVNQSAFLCFYFEIGKKVSEFGVFLE